MLLIRVLNNSFDLYYVEGSFTANVLNVDYEQYTLDLNSSQNEGFIGFFDWLRSSNEVIAGIRLCFFEHQEYNRFFLTLPYVKSTFGYKCMEVLFDTSASVDEELSGDQDFTHNYAYKSQGGGYLFTFLLDHLTPKELESLLRYCKVVKNMDELKGVYIQQSGDCDI